MTTTRTLLICGDCTDEITPDDDHWTDPDTGEHFHADCQDRSHDLRRCDCATCDEERSDDPNWGRLYSPGIRAPQPCQHEDVSNTNPVRSPMTDPTYRCEGCGVVMLNTEPGCWEPATTHRAVSDGS